MTVEDRETGSVPVQLRGNPDHPYSQGELCPKVNKFLDRVLSPNRIKTPLRRVGPKGTGQFEAITWAEALHEISSRWSSLIAKHGSQTLMPFQSAGNQSELSMGFPNRFLNAIGASRTTGSICGLTAGAGVALTYGSGEADDPTEIRFSKTILLWGTNTRLTNRHLWPFIEEARSNGARVIVIDPIRTMTADSADQFIQPLPGTDVALMLAMIHILIRDNKVDHDFVSAHTFGFDELKAHVESWTPSRAAEICGLSTDEIESLTSTYADGQPAFIRTLIGAEHSKHGAQFFRTISMLPALIGSWKHRGGGFARSVGTYVESAVHSLDRPSLASETRRELQVNQIGDWLNDPSQGIHSLLVIASNPLVTFPCVEATRKGLLRDDLFTVVHDQFITETAKYADIVLPATSQIEADEVMVSWGSPHITYNRAAIDPIGESVSNTELFRRLASAMGLTEPALHDTDESLMEQLFASPKQRFSHSLDQLRSEGTISIDVEPQRYQNGGFATLDGRAHFASSICESLGLGRLPTYEPADEGFHSGSPAQQEYPFVLLTPKTHTRFLNSSYSELPGHGDRETGPFVELCPQDADNLGVQDQEIVRVHNGRGTLTLPVKISGRVRTGLVAIPFGWSTAQHGGDGNANSLTNNTVVTHGGGAAFNDSRVAIVKVHDRQRAAE